MRVEKNYQLSCRLEKSGASPQILSTFRLRETGPPAACFGALFAIIPIVNYLQPRGFQGKKMVKWLLVRFYTA
jgi:hypothetical protein